MPWNAGIPDAEWYQLGDEKLDGLIREVCDQEVVALDTETTGLSLWADYPLFWSLSWGERRVCMPIDTLPHFQPAFSDAGKRWVFANAKFDMHMLANAWALIGQPIEIAGDCVDTAVMHALLYEEESHALKDMAKQVLQWRWTDFFDTFRPLMLPDTREGVVPKMLRGGRMSQPMRKETIQEMLVRFRTENLGVLVDYASNDAYGTLKLYEKLLLELRSTNIYSLYPEWLPTMERLFFLTEVPFTKVLWNCERNGVYTNREYLENLRGPMQKDVDSLLKEMGRVTGNPTFNPASNDQLRAHFFDREKLKPVMMTKGGKSGIKQPSVDKNFLEHYEHESELATLVLQFRKLSKLIGTYIDGAQDFMDPFGRIHTRFNQDVARTGRLSSSEPNIQNIPKPESDKHKLRGAFQATKGNCLIVGDYEQLEMRLLACATVTDINPEGAKDMIQIFLDNKDIHMGNADLVFGPIYERKHGWRMRYEDLVEAKSVDKKIKNGDLQASALTQHHELALYARNAIKSVGFGLNYGMKENKLARQLGISKEEAIAIIDAYLNTYPPVSDFYKTAIEETRETGFSFTLLGRRRFHPAILSNNKMDRWSEERKAVNNNIQGTAADAVRLAMLNISRAKLDQKYGCKMLLQVHDELMFECPKETADEATAEIKRIMEHPFPTDLIVPLTVSIGKGPAWDKAK